MQNSAKQVVVFYCPDSGTEEVCEQKVANYYTVIVFIFLCRQLEPMMEVVQDTQAVTGCLTHPLGNGFQTLGLAVIACRPGTPQLNKGQFSKGESSTVSICDTTITLQKALKQPMATVKVKEVKGVEIPPEKAVLPT